MIRPLLGAAWPELVRHRLAAAAAAGIADFSEEVTAAVAALRSCEYASLPACKRLALLEALIQVAADAKTLRR